MGTPTYLYYIFFSFFIILLSSLYRFGLHYRYSTRYPVPGYRRYWVYASAHTHTNLKIKILRHQFKILIHSLQKYFGAPFRCALFQTPRFGLLWRGLFRFGLHSAAQPGLGLVCCSNAVSIWSSAASPSRLSAGVVVSKVPPPPPQHSIHIYTRWWPTVYFSPSRRDPRSRLACRFPPSRGTSPSLQNHFSGKKPRSSSRRTPGTRGRRSCRPGY